MKTAITEKTIVERRVLLGTSRGPGFRDHMIVRLGSCVLIALVCSQPVLATTLTDANETFQVTVSPNWEIHDETEGVDSIVRLVRGGGAATVTLGSQPFEGMSDDEAIMAVLAPMVEDFRRLGIPWDVVEGQSIWSRFRRASKALHADSGTIRFRSLYVAEGGRVLSFDSWFQKSAIGAEEEINQIFESCKTR